MNRMKQLQRWIKFILMFEKVTKSPGSHFLDSKKTSFPFYIFKFSEACTEIQKWIVLQMTNGSSQARESKAADKRNAKSKFFVSHIVNSKPCPSPCSNPSESGVRAFLVSYHELQVHVRSDPVFKSKWTQSPSSFCLISWTATTRKFQKTKGVKIRPSPSSSCLISWTATTLTVATTRRGTKSKSNLSFMWYCVHQSQRVYKSAQVL